MNTITRWRLTVRYCLTLSVLLCLLATMGATRVFPQAVADSAMVLPPPPTPLPPPPDEIFYLDWNITASGEDIYVGWHRTHHIALNGSAVVLKSPGQPLKTTPFVLTVRDDRYEAYQDSCSRWDRRVSVLDSARYTGGPDPFWIDPLTFTRYQRADGSWYMYDPFYRAFWSNGFATRLFDYREDNRLTDNCSQFSNAWTSTIPAALYTTILNRGMSPAIFEGDATGTIFSRSETYVVSHGPDLTVNFDATIRRACTGAMAAAAVLGDAALPVEQVCGCAALPKSTVIDATNRIIKSLNVRKTDAEPIRLLPDGEKGLGFQVDCEGRRVKNAEVELMVNPDEQSGDHVHGGLNRPRGYLNGIRITDARPTMTLKSDDNGAVTVRFAPGKDLVDEKAGIAGLYHVEAKVTQHPSGQFGRAVYDVPVSVPGLQELEPGIGYTFSPPTAGDEHSTRHYGTKATLSAIRKLANDFKQLQVEHNDDLRFYGIPQMHVELFTVSAISLKEGGQFDLKGGTWSPPFREHRYGQDALIILPTVIFPLPGWETERAWLEREFENLGSRYGIWFSDNGSPWNLAVRQAATVAAESTPAATVPNVAVVAFLSEPDNRYTAGAGQTVTYTLGVENVVSGTLAHNVVLTATLPGGLNFVRAVPAASRMVGAGQVVWDLSTLAAQGMPDVFDVAAQIGAGVAPGTPLTVTAQASTSDADAALADNQDEASELIVQPPGPDLVVMSGLGGTAMTVGQPVTFTVEVANRGNTIATGNALTLTLPASVTLVSAVPVTSTSSAGRATWNLGSLAPNATQQVTVSVALNPSLIALVSLDPDLEPAGTLTYTLKVGSATPDFDLANNTEVAVRPVELPGPDLTVSLGVEGAASPGELAAGQTVTYTIFYGNLGNQIAPTTTISFSLWSGLSLVSAQPAPSRTVTSTSFGGVFGWDLGDLEVGESGAIQAQIHVTSVPAEGSLILATVSSASLDINLADNVELDLRMADSAASQKVFLPIVIRSAQ